MRYVFSCLFYLAWLAVLGFFVGCSQSSEKRPPEEEAATPTVGVSLPSVNELRYAALKAEIEVEAAKRPGLRLLFRDAEGNPVRQKRDLEKFLANRTELVIVVPLDAQAMTAPVARLYESGAPVIVLDRPVVGEKYTCYIAPDWRQIGAAAGEWLAAELDGNGKIVEIKGPVDSIAADRLHEGFREPLRHPGYRFVFEGFLDPPRADGAELMADALADVDRIDAVFAFDDPSARAAYETANAAGRAKDTLFIGVGGLPELGAKYVKEGVLGASVLVPTGGVEAIRAAADILAGRQVPKTIVPPPRVLAE